MRIFIVSRDLGREDARARVRPGASNFLPDSFWLTNGDGHGRRLDEVAGVGHSSPSEFCEGNPFRAQRDRDRQTDAACALSAVRVRLSRQLSGAGPEMQRSRCRERAAEWSSAPNRRAIVFFTFFYCWSSKHCGKCRRTRWQWCCFVRKQTKNQELNKTADVF